MGFFNDMKKLLFGAKSVVKSASNKAADAGKKVGSDLADKTEDTFDSAKDMAGDALEGAKDAAADALAKAKEVMENIGETTGPMIEKAKEAAEDVGNKVADAAAPILDKGKEVAEDVGGKVLDATGPVVEKGKAVAEDVGGKVLDVAGPMVEKGKSVAEDIGSRILGNSGEAMDKAKDVAENVGGKVKEVGSDAVERFKEVGEDVSKKAKDFFDEAQEAAAREAKGLDPFGDDEIVDQANAEVSKGSMESMIEKAKDLADRMEAKANKKTTAGFSEAPRIEDNDKSLLDGTDDFFAKADRFAKGDYHNEGPKEEEDQAMKIITDPTPEDIEEKQDQINDLLSSAPPKSKAPGFTDEDGDGDELIDDAEIVD